MNFKSFKEARDLYLIENIKISENENLYSFLSQKYSEDEISEGIMDWLKRNLSPKASKLKKIAEEYYKWLMTEYRANYKGSEDKELKRFLEKETVSSDIKSKLIQVAGSDKVYQDLANKFIVQYRLKAKKDFFEETYGRNSEIFNELFKDFRKSETETIKTAKDLTAKEDTKSEDPKNEEPKSETPASEPNTTSHEPSTETKPDENDSVIKDLLAIVSHEDKGVHEMIKLFAKIFSNVDDQGKLEKHEMEQIIRSEANDKNETDLINFFDIIFNNLDDDAVSNAKQYKKSDDEFDEQLVNTAAKNLVSDYTKALNKWKVEIDKASGDDRNDLTSLTFLAKMFYAKSCSAKYLDKEKIIPTYKNIFGDVINLKDNE